ncbi:hypothetical protein CA13_65490 [Planctomycetes bacterium CA13]|uniref:Uncharacterized protein n=1 Tax=Novipirellula herctigrandis TaxID=2527986 RepID=A0A5C5ZDB5_9BACT|nr:hypothetical protein CA13_65490 [Planctomycetes bacterium CA13]
MHIIENCRGFSDGIWETMFASAIRVSDGDSSRGMFVSCLGDVSVASIHLGLRLVKSWISIQRDATPQ